MAPTQVHSPRKLKSITPLILALCLLKLTGVTQHTKSQNTSHKPGY